MSYLKTSGTKFTLNGSPFFLFGCTIYHDLVVSNQAAIAAKMAACVSAYYNTVRFTNFMNTAATAGSETDASIYAMIDYALDQARKYGLKVIFEMTDILTIATARGYVTGDANCLALYNSFITWLAARTNTVNGRVYSADDTIALLQPVSELEDTATPVPTGNRAFFSTVCGYLRAAFPNHLIQPGGQKPEQILDASYGYVNYTPEDILTLPSVDACSTEPYYTQANMLTLFPNLKTYSIAKNKPWFCNEFGYNQSTGGQTDAVRASEFQFIYDHAIANGCAGFIFWNFDTGVGAGFGVNPNTPLTYGTVTTEARTLTNKNTNSKNGLSADLSFVM